MPRFFRISHQYPGYTEKWHANNLVKCKKMTNPSFTRGEYWLLESAVEAALPICWLDWSEIEVALNKASHGMSRSLLIDTMYKLFNEGLIIAHRFGKWDNTFKLSINEIEAVVKNSSGLFLDPCICRIFNNNCDSPLYTCLRINFAAKIRQEETERSINKDEALKITKDARKHGLILSLEHCIRPYQYNICMCCSCCCVPKQFRYEFGLDVYRPGPYVPEVDDQKCQLCKKCKEKCPVSAILDDNGGMVINPLCCIGCGVCQDTCSNRAIRMIKKREVHRDENEPGTINLYFKRFYLELVMIPLVFVFKLLNGSQQYKTQRIEPREKDIYGKMSIGSSQ